MFDDADDNGDAETEFVDAGEFEADVVLERSAACDTGLTELGELRSSAEKSTGDWAPLKPPNSWSSESIPDVGGLFVDELGFQSNVVIGECDASFDDGGDGANGCIGDGAKSYGDGSAKDMYIGLLAIVLYGLMPFGWLKL